MQMLDDTRMFGIKGVLGHSILVMQQEDGAFVGTIQHLRRMYVGTRTCSIALGDCEDGFRLAESLDDCLEIPVRWIGRTEKI
jgi:hypothetical protein